MLINYTILILDSIKHGCHIRDLTHMSQRLSVVALIVAILTVLPLPQLITNPKTGKHRGAREDLRRAQ